MEFSDDDEFTSFTAAEQRSHVQAAAAEDAEGWDESSDDGDASDDGNELMRLGRGLRTAAAAAAAAQPQRRPPKLRGRSLDDDDDDMAATDSSDMSETERRQRQRQRTQQPSFSLSDVAMRRSSSTLRPLEAGDDDALENADDAKSVDLSDPDLRMDRLRQRWLSRDGVSAVEYLKQEYGVDLNLREDDDEAVRNTPTVAHLHSQYERHMLEIGNCEIDLIKKDAATRYRNVNLSALIRDDPEAFMKLFSFPSDEAKRRQSLFNTMRMKVEYQFRMACYAVSSQAIDNGLTAASVNMDMFDFLREAQYDVRRDNLPPVMKVLEFFMNTAKQLGLRKCKGSKDGGYDLYEPYTWRNRRTVAYRRLSTLREWIDTIGRGDRNMGLLVKMRTKPGVMSQVQDYLETCQETRLPWYKPEKPIHAFDNGYVDVDTFTAYFYEDNPESVATRVAGHVHTGQTLERAWFDESQWRRETRFYYDAQGKPLGWLFEHDGAAEPLRYPVPRRYANKPVSEWPAPPPMHIPMPSFYKILDFQEMTAETQFMFLALIGRLLFNVNQKDKFGVILMLSGKTRSGKSTLLELIQLALFPNKSRVGVLGAMFEKEFGLAKIITADVAFMDECEKKMAIPQGTLKSMATGNLLPVPVKYGDPIFEHFLLHLLFSSNEKMPNFGTDTDIFAMVRRFFGIPFIKTVVKPDDDLETNAALERSRLFATSLLCYQWLITHVGRSGIEHIASRQLLNHQEDMLVAVHPLIKFLRRSGKVEVAPAGTAQHERLANYTAPKEELRSHFNEWLKNNKLRVAAVDDDFLTPALEFCGCQVEASRIVGLRMVAVVAQAAVINVAALVDDAAF